jgi:phospholipase/carboxylesterase
VRAFIFRRTAEIAKAFMALSSRNLTGPRLPPARGSATHLIVLCHGYGADGNDLIGLAPHWQRLLPTVAFAAPNAPEPCAGAPMGYQWFPISRLDPSDMQRGVEAAAPVLENFLESELQRLSLPPERLALVGFSQGTMMSLQVGLRRAVKPAAIVGYSGLLAGRSDLETLAPQAPPILMVHGDADPMIPAEALFASAAALGEAGAAVQWHLSRGVGHSIDESGLLLGGLFLTMAFRGQLARRESEISCKIR